MRPLRKSRRTPRGFAERFARAVDNPASAGITSDAAVNDAQQIVAALAPGVYPREAWRMGLKARLLADYGRPPLAPGSDSAGSRDGGEPASYVAEAVRGDLGRVRLADLEPISAERAQSVTDQIASRFLGAPIKRSSQDDQ